MKPNLKLFLTVGIAALFSTFAFAASTTIPIKVIAFGGNVTIVDITGKPIAPKKGVELGVGSTVATGPNSWIDLAQGEISLIRVKAKTQNFTVRASSVDSKTGFVSSLFKLKNGTAFVKVNHKNLPQGSKYQVQMPELIAGVVGSSGQFESSPHVSMALNHDGTITYTPCDDNGNPVKGAVTVTIDPGKFAASMAPGITKTEMAGWAAIIGFESKNLGKTHDIMGNISNNLMAMLDATVASIGTGTASGNTITGISSLYNAGAVVTEPKASGSAP